MEDEGVVSATRSVAAPARGMDPRAARTRAAIVSAVERLHENDGRAASVAAIAREAGVSRSVFYKHFSDLEDLLTAVLAESADRLRPSVGACDDRSPRQLTASAIANLVEHVESRAGFYRTALGWTASVSVNDVAVAGYARRLRELTDLIRRSLPAGQVPESQSTDFAATFVAGGLTAALTAWLRTDQQVPSASLIRDLLGLMPAWLVTTTPITTRTEDPSWLD